jgi:hypothetical protein
MKENIVFMVFLFIKWVKLISRIRCKKCFFLLLLLSLNFISKAVPILGGSAIKRKVDFLMVFLTLHINKLFCQSYPKMVRLILTRMKKAK